MRTRHALVIRAPAEAILRVAFDVAAWPHLDPAYRWCRILERDEHRLVFEMAGRIRGWPARWTAVCERFPEMGRVAFVHIRGLTAGMRVQWDLAPADGGTRVEITHDLRLRWPLIGRLVSDLIVGPIFIDWIAARTLRGVKRICEGAGP